MFIVITMRRHVQAVQAVDRVNLDLAHRLAARESELRASNEALREAQQRQAVAAERQRLMQDLHDGMGSQLISAIRVAEAEALSSADMKAVLRDCLDDLRPVLRILRVLERMRMSRHRRTTVFFSLSTTVRIDT